MPTSQLSLALCQTCRRRSASSCCCSICHNMSETPRSHRGFLSSEEPNIIIHMFQTVSTLTSCTHRYMYRRCSFLDNLSALNLNMGVGEFLYDEQGRRLCTNTKQLGSTLITTMISEVEDFCDPTIKENWSLKPHQQVVGKQQQQITITTTAVNSFHPFPSYRLS